MLRYSAPALLVVAGLAQPATAFAECANLDCVGVTVDRLYIHGDGNVYIGTSGTETALSCTPIGGTYIRLLPSHVARDQIYALLLTAHENRRPLWIQVRGGGGDCDLYYIVSDK